jgi:hypothetical protein
VPYWYNHMVIITVSLGSLKLFITKLLLFVLSPFKGSPLLVLILPNTMQGGPP